MGTVNRQSASITVFPRAGICLKGAGLQIATHDVIVRGFDGDGYTNVEEYLNATDPTEKTSGAPILEVGPVLQAGNEHLRYGESTGRSEAP